MHSTLENLRELCQMPTLKAALALLASWAARMVGHPDSAALLLFWLLLFDFALGLGRAWRVGDIRARRLRQGAFKFFRYWLAVAVFVMADGSVKKALPISPLSLSDAFIAYLAVNEAFSCVDHLAFFGMPVPEALLSRLRRYRDAALSGSWETARRSEETAQGVSADGRD